MENNMKKERDFWCKVTELSKKQKVEVKPEETKVIEKITMADAKKIVRCL